MKSLLVILILGTIAQNVCAYNILFFHAMATSSHRTAIWPLAERLANVGHNVTYIFPVNKKVGSHPLIREITPSKMVPILSGFVSDFDINLRLDNKIDEWLEAIFMTSFDLCEAFYDSPEIKEWLSKPDLRFDLLFVDGSLGECGYGLVHKFKAKHILFVPLMVPFLQDAFGIVPESSSIPDILIHPKPSEMNLLNRMKSTLIPLLWRYKFEEYLDLIEPVVKKGLNTTNMPSLREIEANASLILINSHFVEDYPMALPPNFISFSGLWCSKHKKNETKPLPKNIANFIEKSDGFFYVSFGSATVASAMPLWMRNHFFNAFRAFPNHKFLWRWTGPIPEDTPENVLLLPWFPQHDILVHPKLVAFMTQTGRPSTQEALCSSVPLITMPIFGDQDYNADRLEYIGVTINLDISKLSAESLQASFKEMIENPTYRKKMKELSAMFIDRPIDPLDNVHYWAEYVMRHNTTLMKPLSMVQTWYQRRLLDVYAAYLTFGLVIMVIISTTTWLSLKYIFSLVLHKGKKKIE